MGIDVGIKCFAKLTDGSEIDNPKHLRKSETRLKRKQRALSRKIKGSSNRKKARLTVSRLHRKVRNQRSDFHHKEARKIVDTCGHIVVENLTIRNMIRNRHLSKSIADAGWGSFFNILAYKAEEAPCRFEKVPPHHTSINCSGCGDTSTENTRRRVHKCPVCGLVLNRDLNAAINILRRVLRGPRELRLGRGSAVRLLIEPGSHVACGVVVHFHYSGFTLSLQSLQRCSFPKVWVT